LLFMDTYTRTLLVRRTDIVSRGDRSEQHGSIIIIIIIIIIIGGGGVRPQSKYDSVAFSSITYTDACGRLLFRSLTVQPR